MPKRETFQQLLDTLWPGLSYATLAERCGITVRTLHHYRKVGRQRAYRTRLASAAQGLGCSPARLAEALETTRLAAAKVKRAG